MYNNVQKYMFSGCIPFLGDVVRTLLADCQQAATSRQWQAWGNQFNGALQGKNLDLLSAAKASCKHQVCSSAMAYMRRRFNINFYILLLRTG